MPTKVPQRDASRMSIRIRVEDVDRFAQQQGEALRDGWIFLPTDKPRPVGTELDIEFCVGELGSSIRARGIVVRSVRATGMNQGPAGMRIRMTLLDEMGKMFIDQIIQRAGAGRAAPCREPSAGLEMPAEGEIGETDQEGLDESSLDSVHLAPNKTTRSNLLFTLPEEFLGEILAEPSRYSKAIRQRAKKLLAMREAKKTARS